MQRLKISIYILSVALCFGAYIKVNSADNADTEGETKRIDMPFIHIDVKKHLDGQKDVDVRAPFVHVHNPAGPNNARVKAPFTKIDHSQSSAQRQPATNKSTASNTKTDQGSNNVVNKTTNYH